MKPKISILVPVYGVEKFIERCAISLFEQTFDDIEYIFVNDCTPDNSIKILEEVINKYPSRKSFVKIFNNESNKGIAATRNSLIEKSNGEFLLFVDSDDYLELNAVELLYNKITSEKSDIVIFNIILEWKSVRKVYEVNFSENKNNYVNYLLSADTMVGLPNKLIKKCLFVDNNIKMIEGVNFGEDFMVTPKLTYYAQKISKLEFPLYHYSQTNINSYTTKGLSKSNIDSIIFVLNDLSDFFESKPDFQLYEKSLSKGKLRKKLELLLTVDSKYLADLINIFPETNMIKDFSFLSKQEKIAYLSFNRGNIYLFKLYRKVFHTIFNFVQTLKRRR